MTDHSTIIGGSTAGRLIECPGSYQATMALPASVEVPSEYAEEGTAMHAVMSRLMERRQEHRNLPLIATVTSWVGETFHDRKLTVAHLQDMILPALQSLADLEREYGGGFEVVGVERRVAFPGVPGAFGTVDLILRNKIYALHVDWKFGSGVGVKATYTEDDGERVNAQLLFYITAARHSFRLAYQQTGSRNANPKLVAAIIQPRSDTPLSHTVITAKDIKWFREDVERAVVLALNPNPPIKKGEHCRFAPCKTTCPLWTGPLIDLGAISINAAANLQFVSADHPDAGAYGRFLADAKVLVDMAVMYKTTIDEQMHAFLEAGGTIPGWRLKAKAKQRQWIDPDVVKKALKKLGFDDQDIWQKKLVTFAEADRTAKRLGVEIPDHLRVAPPTNETTIATIGDPAPVISPMATLEKFQASLKLLEETKGG